MGQNFEIENDPLTEAEAIAVEFAFAQATPMRAECHPCWQCPPERCLRMVQPFGVPLEPETPEFDDGDDGVGEPEDGDDGPTDSGGGGPGGDPDPDGDDDGDGIPNKDDCDSSAFDGGTCSDACSDADGDGVKNQDDCDSPECYEGDPENCECRCSADIEIVSVDRFPAPTSTAEFQFLPPHHTLTIRVNPGDDCGASHIAWWEIEAPETMQVYSLEQDGGHVLSFKSNSGEGIVTITATIECGDETWEDTITFTVKDYDVVDVRYKTWIPFDAVSEPIGVISPFGGDGAWRSLDPARSYFRSWQHVIVDLNTKATAIVQGPDRAFGETLKYRDSDVTPDPTVPAIWAYRLVPGAIPSDRKTLPVDSNNNRIVLSTISMFVSGTSTSGKRINLALEGANPLRDEAPTISTRFEIDVCQEYSLTLGPKDLWIRVTGQYDGFPSHALWINSDCILYHNPIITGDSPFSLFGDGEYDFADPQVGVSRTISARVPRP